MHRNFAVWALVVVATLGMPPGTASGQSAPGTPSQCSDDAQRQFDFWIGRWSVHGGPDGGRLLGRNLIERSANGCWLAEHWESASGARGTSLNAWDAQHGVWRQFWVGADGNILRLEGGLRDGSMVMEGESVTPGGGLQRQRIRWTPNADGSVTQRWEALDADSGEWKAVFVGEYRRAPSDATPSP